MTACPVFLRACVARLACTALTALAVLHLLASEGAAQSTRPMASLKPAAEILLLSSYSADTPYSQLQIAGLREGMHAHQLVGHNMHIEFLDIDRQPRPSIEAKLVSLLADKYSTRGIRIVVTLDTPALLFADRHLDAFAPGASIVFCAATEVPEGLTSRHDATGVVEKIDLDGAIRLIGELQPDLRKLVIVTSPVGFAAAMRELAEAAIARHPPAFATEQLVVRSRAELEARLRTLPAHSAILLLGHDQINSEIIPSSDDPLAEFCAAAAGPVYGLFDTMLNHGIVGGLMTSAALQGRVAGGFIARVAGGEAARSIPICRSESVAPLFDGTELARWNIDRRRLPRGSVIRNEPISIFARYRGEISAGVIVLAVLQGLIILQLLRQRRHIRESEDRYRGLVELCPDAILVHDGEHFAFANPAALEMFASADLATLRKHRVLDMLSIGSRDAIRRRFQAVLEDRQTAPPADAKLVRLDGRTITVEATGKPCVLDGRRHIQVMLRDVTERRRFDEQMMSVQKMETIAMLAGGVAHDFNNILTAMRISVDEARRSLNGAPANAGRMLDVIGMAVERAANLIRQLLAIGGRDSPAPTPTRLDTAILEARPLVERIVGPEVRLDFKLDCADGHVAMESARVEQIIVNLAANAADAMHGRGTLTVESHRCVLDESEATLFRGAPGPYTRIVVRDTGDGIADEHLPRIFEPFFTTKPSGKGTGLGLATVYGIARRAGGTVRVESRVGQGSTFHVLIPCTEPAPDSPGPAVTTANHVVLIVDDEAPIRELAGAFLKSAGYETHVAANGAAALEAAAAAPPTIAIVDVRLGDEHGDALALKLRHTHPDLPILFITGFATSEEMERLARIGGARCLAKPFVPSQLLSAVRELAAARFAGHGI